jgi:hypothetical protein
MTAKRPALKSAISLSASELERFRHKLRAAIDSNALIH